MKVSTYWKLAFNTIGRRGFALLEEKTFVNQTASGFDEYTNLLKN